MSSAREECATARRAFLEIVLRGERETRPPADAETHLVACPACAAWRELVFSAPPALPAARLYTAALRARTLAAVEAARGEGEIGALRWLVPAAVAGAALWVAAPVYAISRLLGFLVSSSLVSVPLAFAITASLGLVAGGAIAVALHRTGRLGLSNGGAAPALAEAFHG
ncbi:MAG: hypothetical protein ABIH26_04610 [Candidatus Eisenbacteria bacterium]